MDRFRFHNGSQLCPTQTHKTRKRIHSHVNTSLSIRPHDKRLPHPHLHHLYPPCVHIVGIWNTVWNTFKTRPSLYTHFLPTTTDSININQDPQFLRNLLEELQIDGKIMRRRQLNTQTFRRLEGVVVHYSRRWRSATLLIDILGCKGEVEVQKV